MQRFDWRLSANAALVSGALLVMASVFVVPTFAAEPAAGDAPEIVSPEKHGFSAERLARIAPTFQRYVDEGKIPGTVSLVARHGEVVHFEATGKRHVSEELPMQKDTLFRLYSQSKPVTAVAVMILLEEGHFLLNDPISKYLPAFEEMTVFTGMEDGEMKTEPAKSPITIRNLLTHTSGLTYAFFPTPIGQAYQKAGLGGTLTDGKYENLEAWTNALAEYPLVAHPGTEWNYSVGLDVLGRLVEVVSGKGFGEFMQERIFGPLGMVDTSFFVPEDKADRFAALYAPTPTGAMIQFDDPRTSAYRTPSPREMGGSGLVGTAADYLRFAQMLLNGGELDGTRILAPSTVELLMSNHLPASFGDSPLASLALGGSSMTSTGNGFGLGGLVVVDPGLVGTTSSKGSYSWGGAATTHFWVDPETDVVGIILTQLIPDGTYPIRETMVQMTYQALLEP